MNNLSEAIAMAIARVLGASDTGMEILLAVFALLFVIGLFARSRRKIN
jgi:hypothetical protein